MSFAIRRASWWRYKEITASSVEVHYTRPRVRQTFLNSREEDHTSESHTGCSNSDGTIPQRFTVISKCIATGATLAGCLDATRKGVLHASILLIRNEASLNLPVRVINCKSLWATCKIREKAYATEAWAKPASLEGSPTGVLPRLAMGIGIPRALGGLANGMAAARKGRARRIKEWEKYMVRKEWKGNLQGCTKSGRGLQMILGEHGKVLEAFYIWQRGNFVKCEVACCTYALPSLRGAASLVA